MKRICLFCHKEMQDVIPRSKYSFLFTCQNHTHAPVFLMSENSNDVKWFYIEVILDKGAYQLYKFFEQDDRYGKIDIWRSEQSVQPFRLPNKKVVLQENPVCVMSTMQDTELTPDNAEQKLKTYLTFL